MSLRALLLLTSLNLDQLTSSWTKQSVYELNAPALSWLLHQNFHQSLISFLFSHQQPSQPTTKTFFSCFCSEETTASTPANKLNTQTHSHTLQRYSSPCTRYSITIVHVHITALQQSTYILQHYNSPRTHYSITVVQLWAYDHSTADHSTVTNWLTSFLTAHQLINGHRVL